MTTKYSGYFTFPTEQLLEDYQIHIDCKGWSDRNYGVWGDDLTRSEFRLFTQQELEEFTVLATKYEGTLTILVECDSPRGKALAVATRMFFCNIDSDEMALAVYTEAVSKAEEDADCDLSTEAAPLWSAIENEPASEVIPLLEYLADDITEAIVSYSNHFPAGHAIFRGCTKFMWCEVALVEDGVERVYEHPNTIYNPNNLFFTLYGAKEGGLRMALLDGNYDYISGQAKALREEGLEGADVCLIGRDGGVSWDF